MKGKLNLKISVSSVWFAILVVYIITSYIAQGVLLPTKVNSLILYLFLAYSVVAILGSGKIKLNSIIKWEIICMVLAFVAMLYSPSFSILGGTYYALIVNFIIVLILTQMPWNEKRFTMIIKTYVISAVLLIILLAITGNLEDSSKTGRLGTELMGNANILAMMLTISAIYAVWLLIFYDSKYTKLFFIVSLIIIYFGMFLSGGRKFVVAPLIFMYVVLLNKTDKANEKHIVRNTVIVLAVVAILYYIIMKIPFFYESIGYRFEGFHALFNDEQQVDGSTEVRMLMIDAAWKKWLKSPIWGYGFDSFKYYNAKELTGHFYYSHNNFVELLYNQGVFGFIAYYSFYGYLWFRSLKIKGNALYKGFVLGGIVTWVCFEYFAITYSSTPVQIMLFFCYYCLVNGGRIKPEGERKVINE